MFDKRTSVEDTEQRDGFTIVKNNGYAIVYSTKGTGKVLYSDRFIGNAYKYIDELLAWLRS
jgi:hypothetical protein